MTTEDATPGAVPLDGGVGRPAPERLVNSAHTFGTVMHTALEMIATMPMEEQDNMLAANMRHVARCALNCRPEQNTTDWRPMLEAPKDAGPLLLLVPTRWAKRATHLQAQGEWILGNWYCFNTDEALQRVWPIGWRPLLPYPAAIEAEFGDSPISELVELEDGTVLHKDDPRAA